MTKVKEGRANDIRRCVAANYCWRAVIRGSRVQCAYNPVVGRERVWGASSMRKVSSPKRVLVIGAGPCWPRIRPRRGGAGPSTLWFTSGSKRSAGTFALTAHCPIGTQYGTIATWLAEQAQGQRRGHQDSIVR